MTSSSTPTPSSPQAQSDVSTPSSSSSSSSSSPEFIAVILAATAGARLFPLTTSSTFEETSTPSPPPTSSSHYPSPPKHLLPIGGIPTIHRLIHTCHVSGFEQCLILLSTTDQLTLPSLLTLPQITKQPPPTDSSSSTTTTLLYHSHLTIHLLPTIPPDSPGSATALRSIPSPLLPTTSHVVLLPGDLLLEGGGVLGLLADAHRSSSSSSSSSSSTAAVTMLLSDIGECDPTTGLLVKESARAKRGGLARDDDEMEYVGLVGKGGSTTTARRVIFKKSKIDVEDDEHTTGETPQLTLAKQLLSGTTTELRTDVMDLHVYALAPWVVALMRVKSKMSSVNQEVIPYLISRQWREGLGVEGVFGKKVMGGKEEVRLMIRDMRRGVRQGWRRGDQNPQDDEEEEEDDPTDDDVVVIGNDDPVRSSSSSTSSSTKKKTTKKLSSSSSSSSKPLPFSVGACILPRGSRLALRSATISSYLYANRELVHHVLNPPDRYIQSSSSSSSRRDGADDAAERPFRPSLLPFPPSTKTMIKTNTIIVDESSCEIGDKVTIKSSIIGPKVKMGHKCKLNNVVVMEGVTLGDNCTLQNSVIGSGVTIGDNVSLNDVQVGFNAVIGGGVKLKGESVVMKG